MIPDGWQKSTLDHLIEIKHGFAFKSTFFSDDGSYVLMTPGSFYEEGGFRDQGTKTKYYFGEIPNGYLLEKGSILLAMTEQAEGLLGSAAKVPEDEKYLHNQRLGLLVPIDDNKVDLDFFYWLFNSRYIRKQITAQASGTKVKHTSPDRLVGVIALIPPKNEQKKIAQILSTWDKAIETVEKLIGNSQQKKKALMQQLLTGKKRFPGFDGEWKFLQFEGLFKIANDKKTQVKSSDYLNVGKTPIVDQGKQLISGYTNNSTIYQDIPVIIFGDHTRIIKWIDFIFSPGADGTQIIKNQPNLDMKFGYYLLANTELPNLGYSRHMRELKEKDFKYPVDIEEQKKIASVLSSADREIETWQQELEYLKQEKKALMQQLLTGKRRVVIDA